MANTLLGSTSGEVGTLRVVAGTINFNTAGGTVDLDTLDAGEVVVDARVEVLTAFNAATTNVLTVGNGVVSTKFVGTSDVTEGTPGAYKAAGPYTAETVAGAVRVTYTQTGTAATTGSAKVYVTVCSLPE